MSTVLEYIKVSKQYQLGETIIDAVKSVSFSIEQGEFSAIVGPSGSGKSTLLHLGAGLDKTTAGTIQLLGNNIDAMNNKQMALLRNEHVGFIFQSFNLLPVLSVKENVEYPCVLYKSMNKNIGRAMELLDLVGLAGQENKRPSMLSGGQRQRVAIARALVNNPSIVFADEPTANLDHKTSYGIMELLEKINRETHTTFVFSTHDPKIMDRAKRLIRIEDGIVQEDSSTLGAKKGTCNVIL